LTQTPVLDKPYNMTNTKRRKVMTAAEAKSRFAESLRLVDRGVVVVIKRYGKPVAVLAGPENLAQLERLQARVPEEGLAKLARRWKDSGELSDALDQVVESRASRSAHNWLDPAGRSEISTRRLRRRP